MFGIIAGNFDVIHPGYVRMFNDMNKYVSEIYVLLHIDPSIDRPEKIKPLFSVEDRTMTLMALKGVSKVFTYTSESDLLDLINKIKPDVRFLGDDYKNRNNYTGYGMSPKIIFLSRDHGWSTTKFKKLISNSFK